VKAEGERKEAEELAVDFGCGGGSISLLLVTLREMGESTPRTTRTNSAHLDPSVLQPFLPQESRSCLQRPIEPASRPNLRSDTEPSTEFQVFAGDAVDDPNAALSMTTKLLVGSWDYAPA